MKFPFQRYIVCWGKIYGSKIIGGGGAPSRLRLLFCKIVYMLNKDDAVSFQIFLLILRYQIIQQKLHKIINLSLL